MNRFIFFRAIFLLAVIGLFSCEKPVFDTDPDIEGQEGQELYRLSFSVGTFEQIPWDDHLYPARATPVTEVCRKISFALFKNGERIKNLHQTNTDANFGKISVTLPAGQYQVVVIAHNNEGTATITSPEEVTFPKNKLAETFYYCQNINVGANQSYELTMKRPVAMFRLVAADKIPDDIKTIRFYYTGGSSTLNPSTGLGSKNSRQTEERTVTEEQRNGNANFDIYTFPHAQTGKLKITVSALSASGDEISKRVFDEVPIKIGQITRYTGNLFKGTGPAESGSFSFVVDQEWTQQDYRF